MDNGLKQFVGGDVKVAQQKLGIPSSTYPLDGETIYVWSTQHLEGSGMFIGGWGGMNVSDNSCVIRMGVDGSHRVTRTDWSGGKRGCEIYEERLDQ